MKMSDRRRIYTGTACINPSPPAVAHFAATRLPAYDCPEGYPAHQVKIENPAVSITFVTISSVTITTVTIDTITITIPIIVSKKNLFLILFTKF